MSRAIQEIGIDTRTIYDRLVASTVGEEISYAELTALIGRNVTGSARGSLESARKMAMRDDRMVFGTVRGAGLKRLSDVEIVGTGDGVVGRIRRAARRGIKTITSISDFESMPNEAKVKHNTFASMFGAIAAMSKPGAVRKLEKSVNTMQTGQLPLGRTLDVFKG